MNPRWKEHRPPDGKPSTLLRATPDDASKREPAEVLAGEVVEVLSGEAPRNGFVRVRLALSGKEGWIRQAHLHDCPEGSRDHARLAGEGRRVDLVPVRHGSVRFKEVQQFIQAGRCARADCRCHFRDGHFQVKQAWFVRGQYLGRRGMGRGPKETLFHGCKDAVKDSIWQNGFDNQFANAKAAFGSGLYFSTQSCKALGYAENYLLLCEVALGLPQDRLTLTSGNTRLNHGNVVLKQHKTSVQCHVGHPFKHEERVVYQPTQCKVVYVVEMQERSPCHGT